jgi:hypothetical protein
MDSLCCWLSRSRVRHCHKQHRLWIIRSQLLMNRPSTSSPVPVCLPPTDGRTSRLLQYLVSSEHSRGLTSIHSNTSRSRHQLPTPSCHEPCQQHGDPPPSSSGRACLHALPVEDGYQTLLPTQTQLQHHWATHLWSVPGTIPVATAVSE